MEKICQKFCHYLNEKSKQSTDVEAAQQNSDKHSQNQVLK